MLIETAVIGNVVVLEPYKAEHVARYHEWMKVVFPFCATCMRHVHVSDDASITIVKLTPCSSALQQSPPLLPPISPMSLHFAMEEAATESESCIASRCMQRDFLSSDICIPLHSNAILTVAQASYALSLTI